MEGFRLLSIKLAVHWKESIYRFLGSFTQNTKRQRVLPSDGRSIYEMGRVHSITIAESGSDG
ncbi:hypothetical protein DPMN_080703 [Dreissena polymorpha]|uniref:Uncharacterized protein n=1 Tax=Dreissena polymorpha TaxID=45954 RepID=A0A9D3YW65_DREPO|nr:hypothetical protein DPMN_080703 [Dreissena polymorpha]